MMVNLRFIGSLRDASGKSRVSLQLEKSLLLGDAIQRISERIPKLSRVFAQSENRRLTSNMLVLINGKEISVLNGLDTTLNDGDEVVFIPVVHGG